MDVSIETGRTKAARDTLLVSRSFHSENGEPIFILIHILGKTKDAKIFEEECISIITNALIETEGDINQRFDGALKEFNGLIKGMLHARSIEDIHMLVVILGEDGTLLVSHAGRAEAYVVRGNSTSQITEYAKGRATPAFVHIANGKIQSQDVFVFSSQRLLRALTPAQLSQIIQRKSESINTLIRALETEGENAALAIMSIPIDSQSQTPLVVSGRKKGRRRAVRGDRSLVFGYVEHLIKSVCSGAQRLGVSSASSIRIPAKVKARITGIASEVFHPKRKKKTHLFLLASIIAVLIVVWATVQLTTSSQRGRSRAELKDLIQEVDEQLRSAENRQIAGDTESAGAILRRAQEQAKQIMDHESGLFRVEALDLLDRIRSVQEEISNIVRLSPRVVVNLGTKTPSVLAQGLIGISDGEFVIYDRQNMYQVLLNALDEPERLSETALIQHGTYFSRYQTSTFLTTENNVMEIIAGEPIAMKTEDPSGWVNADDIEAYLRYLYLLSPENNQIYKYERLSNRYSAPVEYNVNGNLSNAIDMTMDGNVYVLKKGGEIVKLLRGEVQPFVIRRAPDDVLSSATKIFKSFNGNFYFLDPKQKRVIVVTDGGSTGESTYLKQFILEGEQVNELKDIYVDPDDTRLYVLDDKRLYVIDL